MIIKANSDLNANPAIRHKNGKGATLTMLYVSCQSSDDIHDGALGLRCEICHSEAGFKVIKK